MPPKRKPLRGLSEYTPASGDSRIEQNLASIEKGSGNLLPDTLEIQGIIQDMDDSQNYVENILLTRIIPDPKNMRPSPLPREVLKKYLEGKIDAVKAVKEFIKISEKDPLIRFTANSYIDFGRNIAAHGQIKPITCKRIFISTPKGKEERFLLETGEQRFWSILTFNIAEGKNVSDLRIRAVIAPENSPDDEVEWVQRQISENRKTTAMTEVTQAREIARLILALVHSKTGEVFPESTEDENDYFRNIFKMERRIPNGIWEQAVESMRLSQRRMRQSLSVLRLRSDLLDIANRSALSYNTLREILSLPEEDQERAIWIAANEVINATEDEGQVEFSTQMPIVTSNSREAYKPKTKTPAYISAYRGVKKLSKAIHGSNDSLIIDQVCDEIYADGVDAAKDMVELVEQLKAGLQQRISGNL